MPTIYEGRVESLTLDNRVFRTIPRYEHPAFAGVGRIVNVEHGTHGTVYIEVETQNPLSSLMLGGLTSMWGFRMASHELTRDGRHLYRLDGTDAYLLDHARVEADRQYRQERALLAADRLGNAVGEFEQLAARQVANSRPTPSPKSVWEHILDDEGDAA